ncbi:hypothetical protein GCM10025868_10870 [Angustibacter aerolatus]|uniref:Tetrapyrrole methylase domain-containing protein n=1 Tax=Angustibacter aerolatus TaxID=1162965 RepID=A0ABQ6JDH7_9ACTN|nr:SAM-dependent methyltransferase [Angustibacter aerolatus]GMA85837.1 hypothetical protein GCM10025868_10870 [Angustibacter aerolatus]
MRRLLVIGIGAGDPDHLTLQAIKAMRRVDVFLVLDKGEQKAELVALREQMLSEHVPDGGYRVVHLPDPPRDRRPPTGEAYVATVEDWHDRRAALLGEALRDEVPDGGTAGLLVWGDPSLYDSTLRVVERIAASVEPGRGGGAGRDRAAGPDRRPPGTAEPARRAGAGDDRAPARRRAARGRGRRGGGARPGHRVRRPAGRRRASRCGGAPTWAPPTRCCAAGRCPRWRARSASLRQRLRAEKGWIMDTYLLRRKESGS